ncbi:MAG: glycoside hydrolase family 3 N-terminal domain-containing protein [Planctomycetota bacterium]|nr:glycoside hydrolase family 3 N-terminal domain-containing protein [Planctomycetota bacterium]
MASLDLPLLVPGIRLDRDAEGERALALRRATQPWVAGFCLFGGERDEVLDLTRRLRREADRPLFIASDMERGAGQQVEGLSHLPDAAIWGLAATPEEAAAFGELSAREARSVGIDVLFAPVVDVRSEPSNPIVGNRAFGWDPARVALMASAFSRGAMAGGALPVAKHYPGHGATVEDSHDALPVVGDPEHRLKRRDIAPFLDVVGAGCPAVMTAHVHYATLDATSRIATVSRRILKPLFAASAGREPPLIFTDALLMAAALVTGTELDAARKALRAGCDALLYPEEPELVARSFFDDGDVVTGDPTALLDAPALKALRQRGERSAERLRAFAIRAAELETGPRAPEELLEIADRVARRAVDLSGGAAIEPEQGALLVLDDDGCAERGGVFAARAKAAGVRFQILRVPDEGELPPPDFFGSSSTVITMSGVRAWKGAAGISSRTDGLQLDLVQLARDSDVDLKWISMTPLAGWSGVHVPGTGPQVEAAICDRLFPA